MEWLADNQLWFWAACGLGLLCCVLLILLVRAQKRTNKGLHHFQQRLIDELQSWEDASYQNAMQQREEQLRGLHQLNDSLVNTFAALSRAESEHLNALMQQNYEASRGVEQRQLAAQQTLDSGLKHVDQRLAVFAETISQALVQNETRMENLRKTTDENLRLLREENTKKLNEMRATVDEKLNDTLEKRLSTSFSQVSERLEQVYRSLGEMHSLASGVGDLKRMLSNVKTRGVWGELQLGALLEQTLAEAQYKCNVAVKPGSSERVEYAVCLPGRDPNGDPVYLPIDSKFPQEDYARLADASQSGDQPAVESAQKALLNAVRTEAKRIGKYIVPPYTTDFAVMFLPLESLYAEVMRHSGVVEAIQREQRILIAGPSTLLALLNSLQMGFRTLAIEQRSAEVWKLLGAVKGDFSSFALLLQKTQEKLQQATDSIDTAFMKTRIIEKRLRNVETLTEVESQAILNDGSDG